MIGYRALICGLAAAWFGVAPASALTISFSFHNVFAASWNTSGTVSGEIDGLVANGDNQHASAFIIDKNPLHAFFPPSPFSVLPAAGSVVRDNEFSVHNGELTSVNFFIDGPTTKSGRIEWVVAWCLGKNFCVDHGNAEQVLFSIVSRSIVNQPHTFLFATPLPTALPLYAASIALLYALVRRRQLTVPQNAPPPVFQYTGP